MATVWYDYHGNGQCVYVTANWVYTRVIVLSPPLPA